MSEHDEIDIVGRLGRPLTGEEEALFLRDVANGAYDEPPGTPCWCGSSREKSEWRYDGTALVTSCADCGRVHTISTEHKAPAGATIVPGMPR